MGALEGPPRKGQFGMVQRHFELDEAQALVPWLAERFEEVALARAAAKEIAAEIHSTEDRMRSNGGSHSEQAAASLRHVAGLIAALMEKQVGAIERRGIHVKGIEPFLADFLSLRNGRVVYLCWKEDEDRITHWHDVDAGFAGRQPL